MLPSVFQCKKKKTYYKALFRKEAGLKEVGFGNIYPKAQSTLRSSSRNIRDRCLDILSYH